jgi:hypothetical protein
MVVLEAVLPHMAVLHLLAGLELLVKETMVATERSQQEVVVEVLVQSAQMVMLQMVVQEETELPQVLQVPR